MVIGFSEVGWAVPTRGRGPWHRDSGGHSPPYLAKFIRKGFSLMKKHQNLPHILAVLFAVTVFTSCAANLEKSKREGDALRNLGEAYLAEGNSTAALVELLKAEGLFPDDPFLQYDLGLAYLAKEKPDLAITHFKKALELNPDHAPAKNSLGFAYMAKGDWDSAITVLKGLIGNLLYATPHFPLRNLGWAYYNKGDYEQAVHYLTEAIKVEPGYALALRDLGLTYLKMGKTAEAVETLEKGIKVSPRFAEMHFDLARAYTQTGEYPKAVAAYEKVAQLSPGTLLGREAKEAAVNLKSRKK